MRLLLVEDQPDIAALTAAALHRRGFVVDVAETLGDADIFFKDGQYDAILLDRQLPDGDGLSWLKRTRRGGSTVPALIMTAAKQLVNDRIEGLEAGADDYVLKPVDGDELVARVRALLRRPSAMQSEEITFANMAFDVTNRELRVENDLVKLSPRELALLESLIRRAGRVVTKGAIENLLYSFDQEVTQNAIEVAIYRLRSRLTKAGAAATVHTVRGVGYMLQDSAD